MSTTEEKTKGLFCVACAQSKPKVEITPIYKTFTEESVNLFLEEKKNDINYLIECIERMIKYGRKIYTIHFRIHHKTFEDFEKHLKTTFIYHDNIQFTTQKINDNILNIVEININYSK